MSMPKAETLEQIREALTHHFNEDIAQDALLQLCEAVLDKGTVVDSAYSYCWQVAEYRCRNEAKRTKRRVAFNATFESRGGYESYLDHRDPAIIIEAREVLSDLPEAVVLDTPLTTGEARQETFPTPAERKARSRAIQVTRRKFEM